MRRRVGLLFAFGLLLPLVLAAQASAQGALLAVSPSTATPGQEVTVTGSGYNPSTGNVGGVNFRLSTRDNPVLGNSSVSPQNTVSATFPLPDSLTPGVYLLIGTQVTVRGRHTFGTPGRAKLRIVSSASAVPAGRTPAEPPPAVLVGTILAAIALLGGSALCVRRLRTLDRPLGS